MIINKSGLTIRMRVDSMRTMGRATQGVKLINIKNNDAIASVAVVPVEEEEEELGENIDSLDTENSIPSDESNSPNDDVINNEDDDNGTTID